MIAARANETPSDDVAEILAVPRAGIMRPYEAHEICQMRPDEDTMDQLARQYAVAILQWTQVPALRIPQSWDKMPEGADTQSIFAAFVITQDLSALFMTMHEDIDHMGTRFAYVKNEPALRQQVANIRKLSFALSPGHDLAVDAAHCLRAIWGSQ